VFYQLKKVHYKNENKEGMMRMEKVAIFLRNLKWNGFVASLFFFCVNANLKNMITNLSHWCDLINTVARIFSELRKPHFQKVSFELILFPDIRK
jgi:hypothetical protein